jgi:hypothetical protein
MKARAATPVAAGCGRERIGARAGASPIAGSSRDGELSAGDVRFPCGQRISSRTLHPFIGQALPPQQEAAGAPDLHPAGPSKPETTQSSRSRAARPRPGVDMAREVSTGPDHSMWLNEWRRNGLPSGGVPEWRARFDPGEGRFRVALDSPRAGPYHCETMSWQRLRAWAWARVIVLGVLTLAPLALSAHSHPGSHAGLRSPCDLCAAACHGPALPLGSPPCPVPAPSAGRVEAAPPVSAAHGVQPLLRGRAPPVPAQLA